MQAAQGTDVSGGGEGGSEGARPSRLRTNDNDDVPEGGEVAVLVPIELLAFGTAVARRVLYSPEDRHREYQSRGRGMARPRPSLTSPAIGPC